MNTYAVISKLRRVSKRAAALGLVMAVVGLTGALPASAQTSAGAEWQHADDCAKKPEGSWIYEVTGLDVSGFEFNFEGTETYAGGGGYTEADQLGFTPGYLAQPGHGVWRTTGERRFLLTYVNLTYNADGTPSGHGKVRQTTKISESGESYTGSGDYFYYDTKGAVIDSGTFTITAKRIKVEAPQ